MIGQHDRFAMLMVDLDYFKRYNDGTWAPGRQRHAPARCQACCARRAANSDPVFRFGGDEFAMLLPATALPGARTVAAEGARGGEALNDEHRGCQSRLACSIGIAVYPRDGHDGTEHHPRRRSRLLRRQAGRPQPGGDGRRGPRPGGRVPADRANAIEAVDPATPVLSALLGRLSLARRGLAPGALARNR